MKEELLQNIKRLEQELYEAQRLLAEFESKPENNVFDSLDEGSNYCECLLENQAHENCGDGYCGDNRITQEFMVADKKYIEILNVEYNRHDQRYYHGDEITFHVEELK